MEKDRALALQHEGRWRHLWRIAGAHAPPLVGWSPNASVFDVADHDSLHTILSTLPPFAFMDIEAMSLARHPSAIGETRQIPRRSKDG